MSTSRKAAGFERLTERDEWGSLTYLWGGKVLPRTAGTCEVWWPDGEPSRVAFATEPVKVVVPDHGRATTITTFKFVALINVKGRVVRVPLETLWIRDVDQRGSRA